MRVLLALVEAVGLGLGVQDGVLLVALVASLVGAAGTDIGHSGRHIVGGVSDVRVNLNCFVDLKRGIES